MDQIKSLLGFISDQILSMEWLNTLIGNILKLLNLDINTKIGGSIHFFIYDAIKIFILLSVSIFIISYIQSYFSPQRTREILSRYNGFIGNFIGAILGTLTPFCSCSSIPIFIGFTRAGLPIGVTFSFLISSPLVDMGAFLLLTSVFGFKISILYVIVGILLAVIGGTIIDKMRLENQLEKYIDSSNDMIFNMPKITRKNRVVYAKNQTIRTFKNVFLYVIIGVFVGSIIHNWIPQNFIEGILGDDNKLSVIMATLVGVPVYADTFGTISIAEVLYLKGVGIGTILSFMMAVTTLSLPSIIMLKRVVKPKLLMTFVSIVVVGIIIIGYVFNFLGGYIS